MTPQIQFDFSSIDPRRRAVIIGGVAIMILAVIAGIIFLGPDGEGETAEVTQLPTLSPTPSPSQVPSPSGPPTETPTVGPTPTLEPYEYTIQSGDTLLFIIQQYGYRDLLIIPEVIRLNAMASENDLIAGQTLLIPRQTPTIGPTFTNTATLDPLITPSPTGTPRPTIDPNVTIVYENCAPETPCISPDGAYYIHIVREGDTVSGIAFAYNTTIQTLRQDNNLAGENPALTVGQQLSVRILVTLTPTLTPTGGPNSTATPTPTPSAPSLLAPAPNASIPRNESVNLQWAPIRPLESNQYYLVILKNTGTGAETRYITRSNAYRLPENLRGATYEWRVVVVNGNSVDAPIISGTGSPRTFSWGS